ncbi:MAG TPA: nitrous oxide reductase accessory protein NosL [Longimicrobiales bacterium]|nr:nitrous oxide reductase accessory protein NosL [Longimicrobiales bacterium]
MMTKGSRILVLVAALAMGLVYVLPLWRITLQAPQYPEGLGMVIRINTIVGVKQHDLNNINNLNHYIGMKRIVPESIPEMKIMPVVIGVFMLLGLLTAAVGRRRLLYGFMALFLAFSVAGLVDFWMWEYDYGHNLDQENAIIKVPGMSYQPPLIGSRQILNFKAHSWPGWGGWILIGVGALGTAVAFTEFRRGRAERTGTPGAADAGSAPPTGAAAIGTLLLLGSATLTGCGGPDARPIAFGSEACEACLMGIVDDGHAAELVTRTGRAYVFDSVECLAAFLGAMPDASDVHSVWVTDFSNPPDLIRAEDSFFLVSPTLTSPMGLGLTAFGRMEDRDGAVHAFGGQPLDWDGVRTVVAAAWPDGRPAHGGHTETLAPDTTAGVHQGHGD